MSRTSRSISLFCLLTRILVCCGYNGQNIFQGGWLVGFILAVRQLLLSCHACGLGVAKHHWGRLEAQFGIFGLRIRLFIEMPTLVLHVSIVPFYRTSEYYESVFLCWLGRWRKCVLSPNVMWIVLPNIVCVQGSIMQFVP